MRNIHCASLAVVFAVFCDVAHAQGELALTVLDLTITQDGEPVTISEAPSGWPLSFSIGIGPRPFSITLPLEGCDPANEATYVRAYDYDLAGELVAGLVNVRDTSRLDDPMEITFPPGFGMAAEAGVQRVLFADDPASARLDQGFNYFFAGRYAEVTADTVTMTVDRIEGPDWDPLTAGVPFILMIGRAGCSSFPAMPVSLVAVNFGQG
jgi:hypothetical protein